MWGTQTVQATTLFWLGVGWLDSLERDGTTHYLYPLTTCSPVYHD